MENVPETDHVISPDAPPSPPPHPGDGGWPAGVNRSLATADNAGSNETAVTATEIAEQLESFTGVTSGLLTTIERLDAKNSTRADLEKLVKALSRMREGIQRLDEVHADLLQKLADLIFANERNNQAS